MIDENNIVAKSFRMARQFYQQHPDESFSIRLFRHRAADPRVYGELTIAEIAGLIVGDFDGSDAGRDIIVQSKNRHLQCIHETHTCYWPLQYPLLFPYGEDGYQEDIPYRHVRSRENIPTRQRVSLREFVCFRIQEREAEFGIILKSRRLFQQFIVDSFSMVESQRLLYIRFDQKNIRCHMLQGVEEAMERGDIDASSIGTRIVLPSSLTGGRRYMFNNCQDAMSICKQYGYPDLFITITCNPSWLEFKRYTERTHIPISDRPDLACRLFELKVQSLMTDLKEGVFFGPVNVGMYVIEFQKRGLPHAHILVWLQNASRMQATETINEVISAELPDPTRFPKLYSVVTKYMIHGPCGKLRPSSPCMKNGSCSKFYPKKFVDSTSFDKDGYPIYRRRNTGVIYTINGVDVDNRFVVPYNPMLLMKYRAHINLEFCNKSNIIKYLFKYINKGPDRVTAMIRNVHVQEHGVQIVDEIKQFYDCRYLAPCESAWRLFEFHIHHKWPCVQRLPFHLPGRQNLIFADDDKIPDIVDKNKYKDTMFTAWIRANVKFPDGNHLLYSEYPHHFVYLRDSQEWVRRKRGFSIGRLTFIHSSSGEIFYMRLLLNVQRGCRSFESIRTVDGVLYDSFKDACNALGLLIDDREFITAIKETAELSSGFQLRRLFVTLLASNSMIRPDSVWRETWKLLADDILYHKRWQLQLPDLMMTEEELEILCLVEVEKLLQMNGKSLKDFSQMPFPNQDLVSQFSNSMIMNELSYDVHKLHEEHASNFNKLTEEQKLIYQTIVDKVSSKRPGLFFVYGFGGAGKTFLWKLLSCCLRLERKIVLNVASNGIASLLLAGGRTAHSLFCIPIELNEESVCNIKKDSQRAELIRRASLIIWDEAPMMNKLALEAVDRTFRDLMSLNAPSARDIPFGGKVVVLSGDFRQVLPVIPKGTRAEIVMASINSSILWKYCKVMWLTKNLRLQSESVVSNLDEVKGFSYWILKIDEGSCGVQKEDEIIVDIPSDLLISPTDNPIQDIVSAIYSDIHVNHGNALYFQERVIVAPTIDIVQQINDFVVDTIPGLEKVYLSSDSVCQTDYQNGIEVDWLTTEFLNQITCSGIPKHVLKLKKGAPIILLRNIDQANGLCNGTRLIVQDLGDNVIGVEVVSGSNIGDKVFIPRMNLVPSDPGIPFKFQRRQFPVSLCFAMTINKNQGQTLCLVGIYLRRPVFSHGQLYVAISRVTKRSGLKILLANEDAECCNLTSNVVYKEVFQKI